MHKKVAFVALVAIFLSIAGAAFAQSFESYWQPSGKSYPAAGVFKKAQAWAPGQYVIQGMSVNGKHDAVSRTLIVARAGDGWVIETWTLDKKGAETVAQITMAGYDAAVASGDPSRISIVRMVSKDKDGKVTIMEKDQLAAFGDMMKGVYQRLITTEQVVTDGGPVTVPGGSFAGTSLGKSSFQMFGKTYESQVWFSAVVPIGGLVKSLSSDNKNLTELLSFGTDGVPKLKL
jgi:hypothetical protein